MEHFEVGIKSFSEKLKKGLCDRVDLFVQEYSGDSESLSLEDWMTQYKEWSEQKHFIKEMAIKYLLEDFDDV